MVLRPRLSFDPCQECSPVAFILAGMLKVARIQRQVQASHNLRGMELASRSLSHLPEYSPSLKSPNMNRFITEVWNTADTLQ
eukprot:1493790-Amphidinium_carterae.4